MTVLRCVVLLLLLALCSNVCHSMLKAFLSGARAAPLTKRVTICIGNEAADADSIISSLCLAYLRQESQQPPQESCFLPLVSVPRKELQLRRETELLLQAAHLDLADLICFDEVNLGEMSQQGRIDGVILLDHNSLGGRAAELLQEGDSLVREIVDHHKDAQRYPHVTGDRRRVAYDDARNAATVGSTCTLVSEELQPTPWLDVHVATLLMGVICLDTSNGDPAVGKAEPRDHAAMAMLEAKSGVDRNALFARLRDAKMDPAFWRSLTTEQCLLLDYKQQPLPSRLNLPAASAEVGVSSILKPLGDFCARPDFAPACRRYMDACRLDMLVVMTFVLLPEATPQRQLLLLARGPERLAQAHAFLASDPLLNLSASDFPPVVDEEAQRAGLCMRGYEQGNIKASRKQVLPLIAQFYDSI